MRKRLGLILFTLALSFLPLRCVAQPSADFFWDGLVVLELTGAVRLRYIGRRFAEASVDTNQAISLDIQTAHNSENELKVKAALEEMTHDYDLRPWTFTRTIMVDQTAIPHSHPILTIHTRHLGNSDALLSTYLHEELHWFLEEHETQTVAAVHDLMKMYPSVPVGYPDGAIDRESTYLHIVDCDLEFRADEALLGSDRARRIMEYWATDHYRWVYKQVLANRRKIDRVLKSHGLGQPETSAR